MRSITAVLILAASATWAQRAPSPSGFGRLSNPAGVIGTTGGAGFGRIIYPGTGAPVVARNPRIPGAPWWRVRLPKCGMEPTRSP